MTVLLNHDFSTVESWVEDLEVGAFGADFEKLVQLAKASGISDEQCTAVHEAWRERLLAWRESGPHHSFTEEGVMDVSLHVPSGAGGPFEGRFVNLTDLLQTTFEVPVDITVQRHTDYVSPAAGLLMADLGSICPTYEWEW